MKINSEWNNQTTISTGDSFSQWLLIFNQYIWLNTEINTIKRKPQ